MTAPAGTVSLVAVVTEPTTSSAPTIAASARDCSSLSTSGTITVAAVAAIETLSRSLSAAPSFTTSCATPDLPGRRQPHPRATSLHQLLDTHFERLKGLWEERFERRFGFSRASTTPPWP